MRILKTFPEPRNLTELTLLSKLEIIAYLLFFVLFFGLYIGCSRIPVKDIYIEVDRIDSFDLESFSERNDSIYVMTNWAHFSLCFPLSEYNNNSSYNVFTGCLQSVPAYREINNHESSLLVNQFNKSHIDSLFTLYKSCHQDSSKILDNPPLPIFYQRITTSFNAIRLPSKANRNPNFYKKYASSDTTTYSYIRSYISTNLNKTTSQAEVFGLHYAVKEKKGVFDTPSVFDLYDISQCYYRIKIRTQLVNYFELKLKFCGANDFTFVEIPPDSISGQELFYRFLNADVMDGIKKDVMIHVQTKELEGKQATRMFFITAVLSALVTIFLAFIIIYGYRKWRSRSKKGMYDLQKRKHRKYKSRKTIK